MPTLQDEVRALVSRDGVLARKDHPDLTGAIGRLLRCGELQAVLPGVYAATTRAGDRDVRVLAAAAHEPDGVFVEETAAQLSFWPRLAGDVVSCAVRPPRSRRVGFRFPRRELPPELVLERARLRMTVPALTALDLCASFGGDGIDQVLRSRAATLDGLRRALELTPRRPGNRDRRAVLLDSRDEPWSAAERVCHRLLRQAGIDGWRTNFPVVVDGRRYYIDVAFPHLRLAVEVDGRIHEDDLGVFENDRWRQNALALQGWVVLRFTWAMLQNHPEVVVDTVRGAVRRQQRSVSYRRRRR